MTVYICYIRINHLHRDVNDFIYSTVLYDISKFHESGGYFYGIYGFTNKKKWMEKFKSYHTHDIFIYHKKEMMKEDYEDFVYENKIREIHQYKLNHDHLSLKNIPMAKHEYVNIDEYFPEILNEFILDLVNIPVDIFTYNTQGILYNIGYYTDFQLMYGDEDVIESLEYSVVTKSEKSIFDLMNIDYENDYLSRFLIIYGTIINKEVFLSLLFGS